MGYTPRIVAKRADLLKIKSELEEEQYSNHNDVERVAKLLLSEIDDYIDFEGTELLFISADLTMLNLMIRLRLDDGNVYYKTIV